MAKREEQGEDANMENKKSHRLFLDDVEYLAFTRRLCWSPDGSVLLTPASCYSDLKSSNHDFTVYGFTRVDLTQPAFMLPGIKTYATCVRFSPYLYKITKDNTQKMLDLPY